MRSLPLLLASLLLTATAHAQTVLLVSSSPGPGVDFGNLQLAIDVAPDGAALHLVEGSVFDGAVISGKSLHLFSDGAGAQVKGLSVRNTNGADRVTLSKLTLAGGTEAGLALKNNFGPIWVRDCTLRGADGFGQFAPGYHPAGWPGLDVLTSTNVVVSRSTIEGGDGENWVIGVDHGPGGAGVRIEGGSGVRVYRSVVRGGGGGNVGSDNASIAGEDGGAALGILGGTSSAGTTQVMGSVLEGGPGGVGSEDFDLIEGLQCGTGGDGGAAIAQLDATGGGLVSVATSTLTGGAYGPPVGGLCSGGFPGAEVDVATLTVVPFAADHYTLDLPNTLPEFGTAAFEVDGPPGALVFLAVNAKALTSSSVHWAGDLVLEFTNVYVTSLGVLPTSPSLPLPGVAVVGGYRQLFTQLIGFDSSSGLVTLSEPAPVLLLDAAAK